MKNEERDIILETVDTLRLLGGNNGFRTMQPTIRKMLLKRANELKKIVENDVRDEQLKKYLPDDVKAKDVNPSFTVDSEWQEENDKEIKED